MWLYENIENCKTIATGTRMFMLLFIGTFLGSTMSLRYLRSLKDIDRIKNYDWGGMAYATFLHFMNQFSRRSLSSLGGAPFFWLVRFGIFGYVCVFWKSFWLCHNDVCWFFFIFFLRFGCVGPQVQEDVDGIYPRFLHWLPKYRLSMPPKRSLEVWCMVIDNLTMAVVRVCVCVCVCVCGFLCLIVVWSSLHFRFFVIFRCL